SSDLVPSSRILLKETRISAQTEKGAVIHKSTRNLARLFRSTSFYRQPIPLSKNLHCSLRNNGVSPEGQKFPALIPESTFSLLCLARTLAETSILCTESAGARW